jgi:hypothetical protein
VGRRRPPYTTKVVLVGFQYKGTPLIFKKGRGVEGPAPPSCWGVLALAKYLSCGVLAPLPRKGTSPLISKPATRFTKGHMAKEQVE